MSTAEQTDLLEDAMELIAAFVSDARASMGDDFELAMNKELSWLDRYANATATAGGAS